MIIEKPDAKRQTVFGDYGVGIEKKDQVARSNRQPLVAGFCKADILFVKDETGFREFLFQVINATIRRAVIGNNHFHIQRCRSLPDSVQTLFQKVPDIVIDYDDGYLQGR